MHHFLHHLTKEIQTHVLDFLVLITAGILFLVGLKAFQGEKMIEFIIVLSFAAFYLIWATYHHYVQNNIHLKIMIEYILIVFTVIYLVKVIIFP